jgi:hypothetical protein
VRQEPENKPLLVTILGYSQNVVYYGMAIDLLVTIVVLCVSVGTSLLAVFEVSTLKTALAVLDWVLLISIFVELLVAIAILVQAREIIAELYSIIRKRLLVSGQYLDVTRKSTTCPG